MSIELKSKQVTCRKKHACDWCGEIIKPGELAQYRTGVFEGDFFSGYMHPECHQAMLDSDWSDTEDGFNLAEQMRGKTMQDSHR